jgi:hypothetical protein
MLTVTVKLKPSCTMVKVIELVGKLSLFATEKVLDARGKSGSHQPQISCAVSTPS